MRYNITINGNRYTLYIECRTKKEPNCFDNGLVYIVVYYQSQSNFYHPYIFFDILIGVFQYIFETGWILIKYWSLTDIDMENGKLLGNLYILRRKFRTRTRHFRNIPYSFRNTHHVLSTKFFRTRTRTKF